MRHEELKGFGNDFSSIPLIILISEKLTARGCVVFKTKWQTEPAGRL